MIKGVFIPFFSALEATIIEDAVCNANILQPRSKMRLQVYDHSANGCPAVLAKIQTISLKEIQQIPAKQHGNERISDRNRRI